MPLVLTRLVGDGTDGNSFRANFPTWEHVAHDTNSGLMVIRIDPENAPPEARETPFNAPWVPDGPVHVIRAVGNNLAAWTEQIRQRYPQGYSEWDADSEVS